MLMLKLKLVIVIMINVLILCNVKDLVTIIQQFARTLKLETYRQSFYNERK